MTLNTKRTGSAEYGRWIKILICGEPGSGKTLISSTFPEVFYASAEGGLMSIADRNIPFVEIRSTEELFELKTYLEMDVKARAQMLGGPVSTIVVDTIDEVQRIFIKERLKDQKKNTMSLQDYGWLGDQMKSLITGFRNLDLNVVFTCHVRSVQDEEASRLIYKPGLVGQTADGIPGYVDLSLLLSSRITTKVVDNESKQVVLRTLRSFPDLQYPWIKDRSGKLPPEIEVNFFDDYQRIYDLIFAKIDSLPNTEPKPLAIVPAKKPVPQKPATPSIPVIGEVSEEDFKCESCGDVFKDSDQAALSNIRKRKILCRTCYKES